MTNEWKDCSSLQELAAAVARGDEIEVTVNDDVWVSWMQTNWFVGSLYRYRPKKRTKIVVLREALMLCTLHGFYSQWIQENTNGHWTFFHSWLPTPPRTVEVEE